MPQPTKIPRAFASSGDKNTIPDSTGSIGLASWSEGFPAITSTPFAQGGVAPKRADFNGIFNALSAATVWQQQGGVYAYDNATNYEIGNLVIYSGEIYICKTANGPGSSLHSPASDSAETYWGRVYRQNGTFSRMFFAQTSGNYTAPYTGVYRITLKSGGGGGGAAGDGYKSGGGGGGEGGTVTFYKTLTKAQSYPYVIGAGGAAAPNVTDSGSHYGSDGGASSFNGEYTIYGAQGGRNVYSNNRGGAGGQTGIFPGGAVVYITPGQMGQAGSLALSTGYGGSPASGGGGGNIAYGRGGEGAYFSGGASVQAIDGKDGFILIEYAG